MKRVLVTGGSSLVGHYLLPRLAAARCETLVLSRRGPGQSAPGVSWMQADIARRIPWPDFAGFDALIHLAPLPLLPGILADLPPSMRHIVAIGTTSVYTKLGSAASRDRLLVEQQRAAETALVEFCTEHSVRFTLFRPTLVYDGVRDKNVARIGAVIQRFGFFPVVRPGKGLRQPLHADDLAAACVAALRAEISGAYELSGGETLSYRAMVERIFECLGRRPRILPVPLAGYRAAIAVARMLPGYRGLTPEVANRMNQDMVFDCSAARRDLGFAPRSFLPEMPR